MLSFLIPNAASLISPKTSATLEEKMTKNVSTPLKWKLASTSELFLPAAELRYLLVSSLSLC